MWHNWALNQGYLIPDIMPFFLFQIAPSDEGKQRSEEGEAEVKKLLQDLK